LDIYAKLVRDGHLAELDRVEEYSRLREAGELRTRIEAIVD